MLKSRACATRVVLAIALGVFAWGCGLAARRRGPLEQEDAPVATSARPRLLRAEPAYADLGAGAVVEVTLYGTGFTPSANVVTFSGIALGASASDSGRLLRFTVPTQYPARGEVPPRSISAGTHAVTVTNQNGVSDTLFFPVRSGPP